jgi:hypothetical protein
MISRQMNLYLSQYYICYVRLHSDDEMTFCSIGKPEEFKKMEMQHPKFHQEAVRWIDTGIEQFCVWVSFVLPLG